MKHHGNWMDKSVTWGAYLKLASICTVIGSLIYGISYALLVEPAWWKATKNFVKRLFNK